MAGPNFAFCLVIVFLTGELSAILDDHCTDLSYYEEIQYITKPKQCCKPKLQHFCEDKKEEVCKDVLEVQCEPQTRVECQSQTSLADGKKCEAELKRYDYKDCNKKVTTRVDCRQNSVDSCKPKLKIYDDGRAVLTDELTCTPLLYEDCVVVDDAVPGCSRKELKTLCACPHDYIPVCAGDRLYDNLCLYECAKKEAKCADVQGIPALGDVAGCVAPDTKGIVNRDAIKEFKTTLLDFENELANLANSRSRRNGLGFTEDEFKFLNSIVEGKTYLEVECSDEDGQCDVEKINGLIEKSKSTFNFVKETGIVSSGFMPHFVLERGKFDEVADVAVKVQEKSATKRAPQENIPYLVSVVVELDITLGRSASDSRRLLSSRADSALPPGCTAPFQVKWTDFVEKDKTVVEQTSFCEVKSNVECKPVSVKKCTFLDWKECSLRPVQECQTVSVSQPSQEKVHQKKCLKIENIYVMGGFKSGTFLNSMEEFNPELNSWNVMANMNTSRYGHAVVVLNSEIYAIGGYTNRSHSEVEKWSPVSRQWTNITNMSSRRSGAGAAVLDGKIFVVGGYNNTNGVLGTVEIYVNNQWQEGPSLPHEREFPGVIELGGKLYIIGGINGSYTPLKSVLMFDGLAWSNAHDMNEARHGPGVATLDGKIYAAGGVSFRFADPLDTVEVFDPVINEWRYVANMRVSRNGPALVSQGGKLFVLGGFGEHFFYSLTSVEKYDPVMNNWTDVGDMKLCAGLVSAEVLRL